MESLKWVGAGVAAGAIGAGIWAGIVVASGYEVGWIAWGIGALVGLAVAVVAGRSNVQRSDVPAIGAALIALAAVLAGKYAATALLVHEYLDVSKSELNAHLDQPLDEEFVISLLADDLVRQEEEAGRAVDWPAGVIPEEAASQAEYPPKIWSRAKAWWVSMTPEQQRAYESGWRTQFSREVEAGMDMEAAGFTAQVFMDSFSLFDLLWFGLAGVTAFKLGAGCAVSET